MKHNAIKSVIYALGFVVMTYPSAASQNLEDKIISWNPAMGFSQDLCETIAREKFLIRYGTRGIAITSHEKPKPHWTIRYLSTTAQRPLCPKKQFALPKPQRPILACIHAKALRKMEYCLPQDPNSYYEQKKDYHVFEFDDGHFQKIVDWLSGK